MRRYNISTLAGDMGSRGQITADDVATVRKNLFNGEEVWPPEARALFDLMQKRLPACEEWNAFFVEAISEYVVNELEPRGAIDEKNARWLIAMVARDQANWNHDDLHLLVAVMERAGAAPLALQQFALEMAQGLARRNKMGAGKLGVEAAKAQSSVQPGRAHDGPLAPPAAVA